MKRASYIIIAAVMWLCAIAFVVVGGRYARTRRAGISIKNIDIRVADASRVRVATADSVRGWLAESGLGILGRPVDDIDTRAIESFVAAHNGVKHVRARTDLNGNLHLKVAQREPLMRIEAGDVLSSSSGAGQGFWVTRDGWVLPFEARRTEIAPALVKGGDTLLVRGAVPMPFDPSAGVEYAAVERQNFADFLAEFKALSAERQRLTAERAARRAALRAAQASGPKRFWGRARKDAFERQKAGRIAQLTAALAATDRALAAQKEKTVSTRENEKISQENLAFLPKLANFVEFIVDSDFWSTKIARIDVLARAAKGAQTWELRIVPATGSQVILLGALDGSEMEKLAKLEAFYRTGEIARYRHIDVKYKDQIVCRVN